MEQNTQVKRLRSECLSCLLNKYMERCPEGLDDESRLTYMQIVFRELADAEWEVGGPVLIHRIYRKLFERFGFEEDYSSIKTHFNTLMMKQEPLVEAELSKAQEPLRLAIQYSLIGNYIDFGALDSVEEEKLAQMLLDADNIAVDAEEYEALKEDLRKAKRLVYLTDNCGEIVMDKLLIRQIQKLYPECEVTVIVRGSEVLNDATREDAEQIGLTDMVRVIGNGNGIAGTWLPEVSKEAREEIEAADVILAKGQANFETLRRCGKNI
ncbi:MAG: DUF89 family protein [Lachnospiraceae bacterium]|nr:DUF89 family protein [Lachnospiraceae bacterium]